MPGIVALLLLGLAIAFGVLICGAAYWLLRLSPVKKKQSQFTIAALLGLAVSVSIWWDFDRYQEYEIDEFSHSNVVLPAINAGAKYKAGFGFSEGLSDGTYYRLKMKPDAFQKFITQRPHEKVEIGKQPNGPESHYGPDWFNEPECDAAVKYEPDYRSAELDIDQYDLYYCAEQQLLDVVSVRI
jgi:hypothetical protein